VIIGVLGFSCQHSQQKDKEQAVFRKISSSQSAVTFNNLVDEDWDKKYFDNFAYVYNGGGVAIGDINNDGCPTFTSREMKP
jgi:hypothetical protein